MPDINQAGPHAVDVYVGTKMRSRRKALGISQTALADAIGLTFQQIQKYERGHNRISASRLYTIAKVLDVGFGWFVEGYDPAADCRPAATRAIFVDSREGRGLAAAFDAVAPDNRRNVLRAITPLVAQFAGLEITADA